MVHATLRAQPDGEILEKIRAQHRAPSAKRQADPERRDHEPQAPSSKPQASQYGQIQR